MHPRRLLHPFLSLRRRQVLPRWVRRMDAAVGRKINTGHAHPLVDRGYARLSHSADRGRLWFTLAGLFALVGHHRAGLRGIASLTVASIIANLIGKEVFGGDRPLLKDVPVGRHLKKTPTSGSFPSGHSASAAAFATGVALESPRIGMSIAPLAFGVAYSRMHVGAHWFSDVVGGVSLGAGVAALGKVLVPAEHIVPRPHPTGSRVALPALPDGEGVLIVVNSAAGVGLLQQDPGPMLTKRLPKAAVRVLADREHLVGVMRDGLGAENTPRVLGVFGGDGSVSTAAQLAREAGIPLLVLPGGTFNHFARTAGIETVDDALEALGKGRGVRADVAELRFGDAPPITVINTASVGIYPDFVAERQRFQQRLGKWPAAVIAAVRVLRTADPVEVTINGRKMLVWSVFFGVNRNYPATVTPLQRRRLDDGVLDVRIVHAGSRARAVATLSFGHRTSAVLRRLRLLQAASAIETFTVDAVEVVVRPRQGQAPGFAHDGEVPLGAPEGTAPGSTYTSTLRIVPGGLDVYSMVSRALLAEEIAAVEM